MYEACESDDRKEQQMDSIVAIPSSRHRCWNHPPGLCCLLSFFCVCRPVEKRRKKYQQEYEAYRDAGVIIPSPTNEQTFTLD
ncbi:hypothetical protein OUZ56_004409 [Daphnia magna]|uniref:Uncharacterized protein n=1 Tax=Daphnia magna TaxID=35525 RepID=A0ABQ9YPQ2_9CRUS|nr:hypothetical protein OUZ56_004409 [Daphnia magna]